MSIDISKFLGKIGEGRDYLASPLKLDNNLYATNGHVLIRIADDGRASEPCPKNIEEGWRKYSSIERFFVPVPLKTIHLPERDPCSVCDGSGSIKQPIFACSACEECDGSGELDCDLGHTHGCEDCGGTGETEGGGQLTGHETLECSGCGGSGARIYQPIMVNNSAFDLRYMLALSELPNCKLLVNTDYASATKFIFDGGDGFIMPMRVDRR